MNIAFIANHYKTTFFHAVAQRLEAGGVSAFWVSPSRLWSQWLISHRVSPSRILDLSTCGPEWSNGRAISSAEARDIAKQEAIGAWNANNVILMDRLLSRKPHDYALKYISVILREVRRFLLDNQIECVFSEHVWTVELLTAYLCEELRVMNAEPMENRVPGRSFCFFKGNLQAQVVPIRPATDEEGQLASEFYDDYLQRKPRPQNCSVVRMPRPELNWLPKVFANILRAWQDPFDETRRPLRQIIEFRGKEAVRARMALRSKYFHYPDPSAKRPYVLFPLHVQPESSIDVIGAFAANQIELVKTLSRTLPATHDLYVKEHFAGLGNRSAHEYDELSRMPGVRLVHPHADTFSIMSKADLVIGISSTVVYEAALFGRPAVSVVPMYFGELLLSNGFNPYQDSLSRMLDLARESYSVPGSSQERRARNVAFLAWLTAQSFPGNISDSRSDPTCMEQTNLDLVANGFVQLLTQSEAIQARTDQGLNIEASASAPSS